MRQRESVPTRSGTGKVAAVWLAVLAWTAAAGSAHAQPLTLRADAYGQAQAPVGLVSVSARGEVSDWATAEALIWGGQSEFDAEADALVAAIGLRHPEGWGNLRLGRMVIHTGALRPVHADGGYGIVRILPTGTHLEVFGGSPVKPRFEFESSDWMVGGRVSQSFWKFGRVGVAYLHQYDLGRPSDQELGVDVGLTPTSGLDVNVRGAYDFISPGFSEIAGNVSTRFGDWRFEALGSYRSPQRILPATSLFSVIGGFASSAVLARIRWRAAPRLDLSATGGARIVEESVGEELNFRALLRTDDRGRGYMGAEVTRVNVPDVGWTGLRGFLRIPIVPLLSAAAEGEVVFTEDDRRGEVQTWGLLGLNWNPYPMWDLAAAVEARSSPEFTYSLDALLRLTFRWSAT